MISLLRLLLVIAGACAALPALAQGWGWGDEGEGGGYDRRPLPPPQHQSPYGGQPGQPGQGTAPYPGQQRQPGYAAQNPRCRELEMQLARLGQGVQTSNVAEQLARIDGELRQADLDYHRVAVEADRADCYEETFFFGRSLRQTPRCIELDRQIQLAKSKLEQLRAQRDVASRSANPRYRRDDLIAELARNRCGDSYAREYENQRGRDNPLSSFFSDEDPDDRSTYTPTYSASTYKTVCVRLCDGFFFPISYATSQERFQEDAAKCQSQCAAPAELYYSRSDAEADQLVSLDGRPYTALPNAFRNRKMFVRGCSCKKEEYSEAEIAKFEESLRSKRADATPLTKPRQAEGGAQGKASAATPANPAVKQDSVPAVAQ